MSPTTIRAIILAILALVNLFAPMPEELREAIADHATTLIGAVLGLWSIFAALRARKEGQQ